MSRKTKTRKKKCNTPNCRKPKALRPNGHVRDGKCHACRSREWRKNQPMRAAFINLKAHAKWRGIEFKISFRHFACFAEKSELIENMGRTAESLTVDRRDNLKGYLIGNIQPMTRAANSEKRAKHDEIRMTTGFAWKARYPTRRSEYA